MDVMSFLNSVKYSDGDEVFLTGWLVDHKDGLFILADHFPEDYDFKYRVKICNFNIMYQILEKIPSLGGGRSLIFYRAKVSGVVRLGEGIEVSGISINYKGIDNDYEVIEIRNDIIEEKVRNFGNFHFRDNNILSGDWLD